MKRILIVFLVAALLGAGLFFFASMFQDATFALLEPKGMIAREQRTLMLTAIGMMSLIVLPVVFLILFFAWRNREGGHGNVHQTGEARDSSSREIMWWILPSFIVFFLAIITWNATHALDPYRPIESGEEPMTIQVVALNWKWLFIYPEENIASVNLVAFPEDTPIRFELTADRAPMNSFWIPELGGQMYAMGEMVSTLHLIADEKGEFPGFAAEINGKGFSGMKFVARATSREDFDAWTESVKQSSPSLTNEEYEKLVLPSENNPQATYSSVEDGLYNAIVRESAPPHDMSAMNH